MQKNKILSHIGSYWLDSIWKIISPVILKIVEREVEDPYGEMYSLFADGFETKRKKRNNGKRF